MVSTIDYVDESTGMIKPIAAISPDSKSLIETIMFKSFDVPNSRDRIEVIEKGRKFGILVYQSKNNGGASFILQAEYSDGGSGATPA